MRTVEFPGTYYLAYRDLPKIIATHVKGTKALDFGCGTGRSTRFLQKLGFNTIGVDISEEMLKKAKETDPKGDYRLIPDGNFSQLKDKKFDLVLSAFTFDNIPTMEKKVNILLEIRKLLNSYGKIVNLVCSPEIYIHEWASFSTIDFPENKTAKGGDKVRIIITDTEDKRPVEDILWPPDYYRVTYEKSSLMIVEVFKPIADQNETGKWINETRIAPWTIYVLQKSRNLFFED